MQNKPSMPYHNQYLQQLYPLQDKFLRFIDTVSANTFYLTGGTALSRGYFQHRYSDDLDFFSCTEIKDFRQVIQQILIKAQQERFSIDVETISDNFFRIYVNDLGVALKVDFVNESVMHYGDFENMSLFSCVDNTLNILANKITCVTRFEIKDMADLWALSRNISFSWRDMIGIANQKSPVDPLEASRIIKSVPDNELKLIKWVKDDLDLTNIYKDLSIIADDILLGRNNSLCKTG